MNFIYNINNAYKNLLRNRFFNFLIVISVCLGLIFPIMVVTIGSTIINNYGGYTKDPERVLLLTVGDRSLNIKNTMERYPEIETIATKQTSSCLVIGNNNYVYTAVSGLNKNIVQFFDNIVIKGNGSFFSDEDFKKSNKVCIIGMNPLKTLGKTVKFVLINNNKYKVIGTTNLSHFSDLILIPDSTYRKDYLNSIPLYFIKVKRELNPNHTLATLSPEIIHEQHGKGYSVLMKDYLLNQQKTIHQGLLILFFVSLTVLIYSIINISTVLINKFIQDTNDYLIKLSVGASKMDLYIQITFELSILITISAFIDVSFVSILSQLKLSIANFSLNVDNLVVIYSFGIACLCIVLLSIVLLKKIVSLNLKESINEW